MNLLSQNSLCLFWVPYITGQGQFVFCSCLTLHLMLVFPLLFHDIQSASGMLRSSQKIIILRHHMNNRTVKKRNRMFWDFLTPKAADCINCSIIFIKVVFVPRPYPLGENLVLVLISEAVEEKHQVNFRCHCRSRWNGRMRETATH